MHSRSRERQTGSATTPPSAEPRNVVVSAIGASAASFSPKDGGLVLPDGGRDACVDDLGPNVLRLRSGRKPDRGEAAQLTDEPRLDPLRFDHDGGRQHAANAEPPAEQLDMVKPVEERHDDRAFSPGLRYAFERIGQLRCLRRYPHHVHGSLEPRRRRHLGFEVTEEDALDTHDPAVAPQRLVAHQQQDVAPRPSEGGAEEGPDPTGAEHGVPHHRVESTAPP
jgi:hypothetical protein